jgi:O-antigen ligase
MIQSYRRILAVIFVTILFTNVAVYAFLRGSGPEPRFIVLALVAACAPLLLQAETLRQLFKSRLLYCMAAFIAISAWSVIIHHEGPLTLEFFRVRLAGSMVGVAAIIIFADSSIHRLVRQIMCAATVLAVALNLYDVLHPLTFTSILGRSAGLYINPNISGGAITYGFILAVEAIPERYRGTFAALSLTGVVCTLSRGAVAGWGLILPVFVLGRSFKLRRVGYAAIGCGLVLIAGIVLSGAKDQVQGGLEVAGRLAGRLTPAGNQGNDFATEDRLEAAGKALEMFAEHPLVGEGLGATGDTAHNMYLTLGAEHGFLGFLLFPILILAIGWNPKSGVRATAVAFTLFLLWWGLFSHNLLEEYHSYVCYALMDAIARRRPLEADAPAVSPALSSPAIAPDLA